MGQTGYSFVRAVATGYQGRLGECEIHSVAMKNKKKVTAAELMAELNADPAYVAARAKEEETRQRIVAELRQAESPLLEDLRSVGISVNSVWDLVNTSTPYSNGLPILLDHLSRSYPGAIREGIARALAVKEAKFAWPKLIFLYQKETDPKAKDGLAVALAAIADDETIGDVVSLTRDLRNGPSRLLLLRALARSSDPNARQTLIKLQNDPELTKEIKVLLRCLK